MFAILAIANGNHIAYTITTQAFSSYSDVRESDFGDFGLVFMNANNDKVTVKFSLQQDTSLYLIQTHRLLLIVLAVIVGTFLVFLFLQKCVGMEVRWIWQNICKPYEKGRMFKYLHKLLHKLSYSRVRRILFRLQKVCGLLGVLL